MAPAGSYGRRFDGVPASANSRPVDEGRLDPKLERLPSAAAPAALPAYLFIGLPICFCIALGIILIGFNGSVTIPSLALLVLGGFGLVLVRYLNRSE